MNSLRWFLTISPLCLALVAAPWARGQSGEIATKDAAVTFKSGVNLVPVTVVVRDGKGHAVGSLGRDDFQLFDNGKPQMISKFSVEKLVKDAPPAVRAPQAPDKDGATLTDAHADGIPDRFVAYFFDDLHMTFGDLVYTRNAARKQIDSSGNALERAAIYTTSGAVMQDFTGDKEKLHAALLKMGAANSTVATTLEQSSCPPMTYYMGDQITNHNDQDALKIATDDAMVCANLPATERPMAVMLATTEARNRSMTGDRDAISTLDTLRNIVKKMAAMPGQRLVVMVSDGFPLNQDRLDEQDDIIERAVRANVVIGGLDARGLYVPPSLPDASQGIMNTGTLSARGKYLDMAALIQSDVMATFADSTGGNFYHNSNDYDEGMALTTATPEYLYVLGFSPLDLKLDGRYHNLKVTLRNVRGLDLQVRKGYYAPRAGTSPAEKAKQEIEETFFSRDELHDLPAVLQTQFFRGANGDATLSTVAKIDIQKLAFRKDGGRNLDNLTVLTGLFDNDGNYVTGMEKTVEMRLLDDTLEKRAASGISLKSSFPVHSGRYMVRMVVRDSEGQLMSAQSGLVDIP